MNINANRIWLITDTHLGVRSNSREWMDIIENWFKREFFPLLRREGKEGDIIVHCGDFFDSRQAINLFVMNKAIDIMEEMSNIFPVYMIVGNHDIFMKNSNDINSLKIFKHIKNVTIFTEPQIAEINSKKVLFMPWIENYEDIKTLLCNPKYHSDILFCHTDVKGFSFNPHIKIIDGNSTEDFNCFKQVYSGHIHYSQKHKNIRMLGCPYELTRSDSGNVKGIWMLDLENDTEHFFKTEKSPRFLRCQLDWILERPVYELQELFQNNFVDVMMKPEWSLKIPFSQFCELFTNYRKINPIIISSNDTIEMEDENQNSTIEEINIVKLISNYIESLSYSDALKEKVKDSSIKIYQSAIKDLEGGFIHED